jgi:hypothetical protein
VAVVIAVQAALCAAVLVLSLADARGTGFRTAKGPGSVTSTPMQSEDSGSITPEHLGSRGLLPPGKTWGRDPSKKAKKNRKNRLV